MLVLHISINHTYVETLSFFTLQFSNLLCDNNVLKVWLGLSIKTTWYGLGKDPVLA